MVLTVSQCFIMIFEVPYWEYICSALFAVVLVINFRLLLSSLKQVIGSRKGGQV
jgi:hypothetical protein